MKKLLKVLLMGVGSAVVALVFAFVVFYFTIGKKQDAESKLEAERLVTIAFASWDYELFKANADDELLKTAPETEMKKMFEGLASKLGSLKSIDDSKGDSKDYFDLGQRKLHVTAEYDLKATFEKAGATISVRLKKTDGRWKLLKIFINSPALHP